MAEKHWLSKCVVVLVFFFAVILILNTDPLPFFKLGSVFVLFPELTFPTKKNRTAEENVAMNLGVRVRFLGSA